MKKEKNFIKFLGTAGARVVVARQLRSSAGIWLKYKSTNLYIDPGPGALVKCFSSKPKLDPITLDAIILSHNHLDHAGDVNAMIEAMTIGGHSKKGILFAPQSALNDDPIVLKYVRKYLEKVVVLKEFQRYKIKDISFCIPRKLIHGQDTFGFKFFLGKLNLSYISDTRYFEELPKKYKADIMIINVLKDTKSNLDHLSIDDVEIILQKAKPKIAILTHFGKFMLDANPKKIAKQLSKKFNTKVIAAFDGMRFDF